MDDMKIRLRSSKLAGGLGLLLALGLIAALAVPALAVAVPQMPHQFWGTVTIGATLAPEGTIVSAQIDGVEYESGTVDALGRYGYDPLFKVPAEDLDTEGGVPGDTVEFYITNILLGLDEVKADEEALFEIWGQTNLDLTVPGAAPEVTTNAATDVTTESATLNGNLDSLGDYSSVNVSFEWGETLGGPYPNETTPETMASTGPFSAPISGLASNTTYYFRAKATGSVTVYGDEQSFTTPPLGAPEVTTADATDITTSSATLNGTLDSLGDYSSVDVSFEWGTTSGALDQETIPPETMTSTGPFSAGISGLAPDTPYYFRAKATGSVTVYGDEQSFTTPLPYGTLSLVEGINIIAYTGVTTDLPEALTNIGPGGLDVVDGLWARGAWTGGEWLYYNARITFGTLSQLEEGRAYIIVVTEDCIWELP